MRVYACVFVLVCLCVKQCVRAFLCAKQCVRAFLCACACDTQHRAVDLSRYQFIR